MLFHLSSPVFFFSHLLDSGRALDLVHGSFYVEVSMDSVGLYPSGEGHPWLPASPAAL